MSEWARLPQHRISLVAAVQTAMHVATGAGIFARTTKGVKMVAVVIGWLNIFYDTLVARGLWHTLVASP